MLLPEGRLPSAKIKIFKIIHLIHWENYFYTFYFYFAQKIRVTKN